MDWFTAIGLPADPYSSLPPQGLESTLAAVSPPPAISTAQSIWDTIKSDSLSAVAGVESGVKTAYGGVKSIYGTVYSDVKSGVGTVYDDVSAPVESALTKTYLYLLLGVAVLGGVIYFAGKSGALKIDRIV